MSTFTEERKARFLEALRATCNITLSARHAGVSTGCVSDHRKSDVLFSERFDEALSEGIDLLEHKAHTRAFEGVARGVYHQGALCGEEVHYSDPLTMFLLKAHRPEKYRERSQVDSTVNGSMRLEVVTGVPVLGTEDLV